MSAVTCVTPSPAGPAPMVWTAAQLAAQLNAELHGNDAVQLHRVDGLERADAHTLTFIRDAEYGRRWAQSNAGAALVSRAAYKSAKLTPGEGRALIVVDDADAAMAQLLEQLAPPIHAPMGLDAAAQIDPTAKLAPDVRVGACAVIGPGSVVGPGTVVHAGVVIGARVRIGNACVLHARVVIEDRCVLGDRVELHAGVVIGADGFGLRPAPDGHGVVKVRHIGHVELGDDVEIGTNSCVDRGKFGATRIGAGTKIDNLVQIAHNVQIGRSCVICGCSGIGGSTTVADGVTIGGHVGIADNLTIGEGARLGAKSGVMHDVPAGETWLGYPAQPAKLTMRMFASLRRLARGDMSRDT
ncbi:MAG: UDP-3-O-(3-hydroxymyristoyl)glucosamine N-acyltransferase [Phycisphaerales bacterium]|nr:UDP-3-O-(3-hydroxymyristoyl)glucosamine N-acyltransferase [Phycisphaerales bacterium]